MKSPRDMCPCCCAWVALRKDGTLRRHYDYDAALLLGNSFAYPCRGSGKLPIEVGNHYEEVKS